jgi:hypothetical protein
MAIRILQWEFSDTFERFYHEQVIKFGLDFRWELCESLPEGILGRARKAYKGNKLVYTVIQMRPSLPTELAELVAAEEIMHFVLYCEGYPSAIAESPWNEIASEFVSMIQDLLIHKRLSAYGFNLGVADKQGLEVMLKEIEAINDESSFTGTARIHAAIVYASRYLEFTSELRRQFETAFDAKLPNIAKLGNAIAQVIDMHGYESPEQCLRLMIELRTLLKLDKLFRITDERTGKEY